MKVATRFNTEFLTTQWLANLLKMQGVVLTVKGIIFVLFNRVTVKNCRVLNLILFHTVIPHCH